MKNFEQELPHRLVTAEGIRVEVEAICIPAFPHILDYKTN